REIGELLRLFRRETVTILYGQSGLGKTSLLRAGLFPKLRAQNVLPVYARRRAGGALHVQPRRLPADAVVPRGLPRRLRRAAGAHSRRAAQPPAPARARR